MNSTSLQQSHKTACCDYKRGRVSVIIPTYNYGRYVFDAVTSAIRQNLNDLEIIVVDDGSTDNTYHILRQFNKRIKYIYQKNSGPSAARNTGIEYSSGEFIQFLDADDLLAPNTISAQLEHLNRTRSYIAVCRNKLFTGMSNNRCPEISGTWRLFEQDLGVHLCYFNIAPPNAFLIHRNVLSKAGTFDAELWSSEDYDLWLRAAVNDFVPSYNPDTMVFYRKHAKSSTTNLKRRYILDLAAHLRLFQLLDRFPLFPHQQRIAGLMAFSAGAILTSSRLNDMGLHGSEKLLDLALQRIEEAARIALCERCTWNVVVKLYCLRMFSTLKLRCFRQHHMALRLHEALLSFLGAVGAPRAKSRMIVDVIRTALTGPERYVWERWRLITVLSEYYRNIARHL